MVERYALFGDVAGQAASGMDDGWGSGGGWGLEDQRACIGDAAGQTVSRMDEGRGGGGDL